MDNRKKKRNKQKNNQNPNTNTNINTEVLNTEAEEKKTEDKRKVEEKKSEDQIKDEEKKRTEDKKRAEDKLTAKEEEKRKDPVKAVQKDADKKIEDKKTEKQKNIEKPQSQKTAVQQEKQEREKAAAGSREKQDNTKKENSTEAKHKKEEPKKEETQKAVIVDAAKILLPVAACALIIAVVISFISRKDQQIDNVVLNADNNPDAVSVTALGDEPLAENAVAEVNELMRTFCTAMADGDMDTVKAIKDYNTDKEIVTYKEKSEFIERYDNIKCYTKHGMEENSYFVYVTYDVKFKDIETEAPGLNAFYVYTSEDGSLKIDGDTEENIKAAFKLVTSQDDVVDLYNEINVRYTEATASDEMLDQFMEELPATIRSSVGVALAQLETQDENGETSQTETAAGEAQPTEAPDESEEPLQNQTVNQIVRTTDTVNVRSSDSEEADKIGKAQAGTELRRIEDRVNGWSKVIFEDKESFIKSDYLEVISDEATTPESIGTVTATTNVNVRSQANQESERLGSAQAGSSYTLLEDQGEWYKIDYNGTTGFVKAEFFTR